MLSGMINKISIQEFKRKLKEWQIREKIKEKAFSLNFKFQVGQLLRIKEEFYKKAIEYICLKNLPQIFQEDTISESINVSLKLKELYYLQKSLRKKDHLYHMMLIVTIKATVSFLNSFLSNIEVSHKIEDELFIALQHVLLGLKVSPLAFDLLIKRYLGQKEPLNLLKRRQLPSCKIIIKQKAKVCKTTKYLKHSRPQQTDDKMLKFNNQNQTDFLNQVKQNLKINTFPKITHKKLKLEDLKQKQESKLQKTVAREILSTKLNLQQLSSSMSNAFTQNELKQNKAKRAAKLPFRPAIKSTKVQIQNSVTKKQQNKQNNKMINSLHQHQSRATSINQWQKSMLDMKNQPIFKYLLNSNQKKHEQSFVLNDRSQPITQINESQDKEKTMMSQNPKHVNQIQCQTDYFLRSIVEDIVHPKNDNCHIFMRKKIYNSSFLKKQKKQFEKVCQKRQNKIRTCSLKPVY